LNLLAQQVVESEKRKVIPVKAIRQRTVRLAGEPGRFLRRTPHLRTIRLDRRKVPVPAGAS